MSAEYGVVYPCTKELLEDLGEEKVAEMLRPRADAKRDAEHPGAVFLGVLREDKGVVFQEDEEGEVTLLDLYPRNLVALHFRYALGEPAST